MASPTLDRPRWIPDKLAARRPVPAAKMSGVGSSAKSEQLALFGAPKPLWRSGPHPRSLAADDAADGGAFLYQECPEVFFGRDGVGPMRVAMDTSILIDYAEFGEAIWSDDEFDPAVPDPIYREELIALGEVMNVWTIRDIRLHVFDRQFTDCVRAMTDDQAALRLRQVEQLRAALLCLGHDTVDVDPRSGDTWPPAPDLSELPKGADRDLVSLAIEAGCHVFLTRDKLLLKRAEHIARYWVAVLSPSGLLDVLAESGELGLTSAGHFLLPDSHKFVHVMGACRSSG